MKATSLLCALVLLTSFASRAYAYAKIQVKNLDGTGEGFNDPKATSPIAGNDGTTLGEQRLIAVQHAADLWGSVLDSDVPIVIEATFDSLGCTGGVATILAQASTAGVDTGISRDGANPALSYPQALAERLAGKDLDAGGADIVAFFNTDVDTPSCLGGLGFYYGLDGQAGDLPDLVNTALHEFGHGLGVSDLVNHSTGALLATPVDAYSTHVLDLTTGKHWDAMSATERVSSFVNVRNVVWDGAAVTAAARDFLAHGMPQIATTPAISGFSALISDAAFGGASSATSVSAPLILGNPIDGSLVAAGASGKIVLLRPTYRYSAVASMLERAGGLGVLMVVPADRDTPPLPLEERSPATVKIPVLSVTDADAKVLQTALGSGAVTARISADPKSLIGADSQGRVFLNATRPVSSSSISHWDPIARPNLLMEPISTPGQPNEVDLTKALLIDLGWAPFCGNGRIDQKEACDDAARNSDTLADACRSDCSKAHCGDGVKDRGEDCDQGARNSDSSPDACRSDCRPAHCGDGVKDRGEACDQGTRNSDSSPDACRSDCTPARCGDGVEDRGEACDQGPNNSDSSPDACRSSCTKAHCGDGVVDQGEACDDGPRNSATTPDACRADCSAAHCGDGVKDQGEACDDGDRNSNTAADACRSDCTAPRCGDGVKDKGEACDSGKGSCTACKGALSSGGDAGAGKQTSNAKKKSGGGCGCSALGAARASHAPWVLALGWLGALRLRRYRRTSMC